MHINQEKNGGLKRGTIYFGEGSSTTAHNETMKNLKNIILKQIITFIYSPKSSKSIPATLALVGLLCSGADHVQIHSDFLLSSRSIGPR